MGRSWGFLPLAPCVAKVFASLFLSLALGYLPEAAASTSSQPRAGVRSYVVRRLYQPNSRQKFNVSFKLEGEIKSSLLEQSLPLSLEALIEIETRVLSVEPNGIAKMRYTWRYRKQVVDLIKEEDLPKPFTMTIRITPSGSPVKEEAASQFRQRSASLGAEQEDSFAGIPFLLDASDFLLLFGLDIIPGPFYPLPPGVVMEGDHWDLEHLTPFLDTQGGKLGLEHATLHTYPSGVKVIGKKELNGRPVLQVRETYNSEVKIPLGDTLFEIVRLEGRNAPHGTLSGRVQGTTDFYYALADGALILATGKVEQKLRAEYDRETVVEWQPDEAYAEWEIKASFRQALVEEKVAAPSSTTRVKGKPKKKR